MNIYNKNWAQYEYSYNLANSRENWAQKKKNSSPGIARVKFWSIVLIAYHYIVLRDDGAEFSDGKTV